MQTKKVSKGFKDFSSYKSKYQHGRNLCRFYSRKLRAGWTPLDDHIDKRFLNPKSVNEAITARGHKLEYYIDKFLEYKSGRTAHATIIDHRCKLGQFRSWAKQRKIEFIGQITVDVADDYAFHITSEKCLANNTFNDYIGLLKQLFGALVDREVIRKNPFRHIKMLKKNSKPAEYIPNVDRIRIARHLKNNHPEHWLFIQFVYYCFMRPFAEIRFIQVKWIDFQNETITIPVEYSKKNKKQSTIPIPTQLFDQLAHLERLHPETNLFTKHGITEKCSPVSKNYYQRRWVQIRKELNLNPKYTTYSFKHTGAINALTAAARDPSLNISVKDIQMHMRHHSLEITDQYLRQMIPVDSPALRYGFPNLDGN